MSPGERARRKRKSTEKEALYAARVRAVRAAGGSCDNCKYILRDPSTLKGTYCGLTSDFHGYTVIKPEHACADWQKASSTC